MDANVRTCPECGATTRESARFCSECGSPLPEVTTAKRRATAAGPRHAAHARPSKKSGRGRLVLAALAGGLAALTLVTCALVYMGVLKSPSIPSGTLTPSNIEHEAQDYNGISSEIDRLGAVDAELVSLDATDFPTMRAYVRVADAGAADVLSSSRIALLEGVTDGEMLEREVRSLTRVAGTQGQSYGIAVDKSGSMGNAMPRVREILSDFFGSLDYGVGDRAELLSFDTYVMWMCTMTGDASRLRSGIDSMEAWGDTALWDALCEAVGSVGSQAGSRCVIAFTDGVDNASLRGPNDVASLAESLDVPVFIVGTKDADEAALRDLASRCGGTYLPIGDVEGLSQALADVRTREEGLWCLEYACDAGSAADAQRRLSVVASDGRRGCRLEAQAVPAQRAVAQQPHASRYELIKADASWTEANAECMRRGGHLATVTSQEEMDAVTGMCEAEGLRFCWIGGYTSLRGSQAFGHWVTGEPFDFQPWWPGEPSRTDRDGTPEMYLILWKPRKDEGWSFNDERDRPFEDEEMDYMYGNMGYVCEWEDEDVATAPVAAASAQAEAPQPEEQQPSPEPVKLSGGGFTFCVPDVLAAYEGVELTNDDKGLPCVKLAGRTLLSLNTDMTLWDTSGARDMMDTREVAAGTLQISEYDDNVLISCLAGPDNRRVMVGVSYYGPTTRLGYGEDVALAHRDCMAAVCGMSSDDDPIRIGVEFLALCANGVSFDAVPEPEPVPAPEPEAASGEARVIDENAFEIGGMRFTIPEYWRGKVDVEESENGVRIRLSEMQRATVLLVDLDGSTSNWDSAAADANVLRYGLPDGSEALNGGQMRMIGGATASVYRTDGGACIFASSVDLAGAGLDEEVLDFGGVSMTPRERIQDLWSFGTDSPVDGEGRFMPFVELWASTTPA